MTACLWAWGGRHPGGLLLARAIKADARLAGISLVMLSPVGQKGPAAAALEAGATMCLSKPVRPTRLLNALVEMFAKEGGAQVP